MTEPGVPPELLVVRLDDELPALGYAYRDDAALDLAARVDATMSSTAGPQLVPTGIAVGVPAGYVGLICPRSGLAAKHGVSVLNAPGIIDAGYRGELGVVLYSVSARPYTVRRGDRIAQLLIQPIATCHVRYVAKLGATARGDSGFGSTG
jgi:dUTP pyrophosphatase